MREQHRFMRGIVAWLGMKEALITFDRPARVAGETKYPLSKLVRLAWTAISSSSVIPLKIMSYGGGLMLGGSLCILALGLVALAIGFSQATNALWVSFFAGLVGLQLCSMGLLGDYIGRIFEESKGRPLYVVGDVCNIDSLPQADRSIWLGQSISPHSLEVGAQTRGKSHREQRDPMVVPLPKRDAA
jgi:dolichol-phosphate mannosyltransferase